MAPSAGFPAYCIENHRSIDIVNASRGVLPTESTACRQNQRSLSEFLVARDALSIITNNANDFTESVSREQVQQLFTTAVTWNEVDSAWPAATINRYSPSADSGTMDFFVEAALALESLDNVAYESLVAMYAANVSRGRCRAVERERRFFEDTLVCEDPELFAEVCASENPPTACTLEPRNAVSVQQLIQSDVVQPRVLASWNALESILNREEILLEAAERYPNADVFFLSLIHI